MTGFSYFHDQKRLISSEGTGYGGSIYFYYSGTSNIAPIYDDVDLLYPKSNPVVVAAGALVPQIYLDSAVNYRRVIVYDNGEIDDTDPLPLSVTDQLRLDLSETTGAALVGVAVSYTHLTLPTNREV